MSKRLWPGQKSGPFQHELRRNVCDMVMGQWLQYGSGQFLQVFNRVLTCWCHIPHFCAVVWPGCAPMSGQFQQVYACLHIYAHTSGQLSFAHRGLCTFTRKFRHALAHFCYIWREGFNPAVYEFFMFSKIDSAWHGLTESYDFGKPVVFENIHL